MAATLGGNARNRSIALTQRTELERMMQEQMANNFLNSYGLLGSLRPEPVPNPERDAYYGGQLSSAAVARSEPTTHQNPLLLLTEN